MSEQAYEWIEYRMADGVATITFNAPQFSNALGLKGLQEFLNALYRADADDAVRCGCGHRAWQGLLRRIQSEGNPS